jgi:uncharacterized protein involved in outer membrane biogenesis
MSNGLLYIAGLLSLALAALFAVPYFVDWNGYRGVFEEEATRILGREVRVGGNVNVRLLPSPYVSFEKLRIADPTGVTGEPFFRAESFTMRLSVPPLLKGIVEANEVVLEEPVLRLAVDEHGAGNWRSFSIAAGSLPFVPAGVTLQSVKITDGTLALHGPKGTGVAELDGLHGELKADSISGPYAFRGMAEWQGGEREVRIATNAADADGSVRFKATVRSIGSTSTYVADGRLSDLQGKPRIDGNINAKLALEHAAPAGGSEQMPLVDFKAEVAGDAMGLRLDNIALAFENVGQPQLISGNALAHWADVLTVNLNLSSRWLDLDRVAKAPDAVTTPFETGRDFVTAVLGALPKQADSTVTFNLDQATLGGEAVSGVRLEVGRTGGALMLNRLRAGLPGGAKLALDGTIEDATQEQAFRGDLTLHGTSLARFLQWAVKDESLVTAMRNEGAFSVQGDLALSERGFQLTGAGAEIGGRPMTGELSYTKGERPRFAVKLDAQELDAVNLWPATMGSLHSVLTGTANEYKPHFAWLDAGKSDIHVNLRAGTVITAKDRLRDVDVDVSVEQGRMTVRGVDFVTDDGLRIDVEGAVADITGAPKGALHWVFSAPTADAYRTLAALLELPEASHAYGILAPMRLAGSLNLGERQPGAADVLVDGSAHGSGRLVLSARLDGGLGNWRDAPADISATVDGTDIATVLEALGSRAQQHASTTQAHPGEVYFKAVGIPSNGMTTTAAARGQSMFLGYDGKVAFPASAPRALDGELRVSAASFNDAISAAGFGGGASLQGKQVVGTFKVASADRTLQLQTQQLEIGGSKIAGTLALASPSEGLPILTGELDVDSATLTGLLATVVDAKQPTEDPAGDEPLTAGKHLFPEHPFDFAILDRVEAKLGIEFGTLEITDGMAIRNARAQIELEPGKLAVTKLTGKALDGDVESSLVLERAPGGASASGTLRIAEMHAKKATSGADGLASLSLQFSGRASTPGALVSVASGKGELKLGEMSLHAPTPLAVIAASEAVLTGEAGGAGEMLIETLQQKFDAADVAIGPRTIPIEIADGAAKLALVTLDSPGGTTKVETTVDLASLFVDSAWVAEPRAPDASAAGVPHKNALPSVGVVYTGPLAKLWSLERRITAEPLERELAIRRMELDADQLERLHRADSERARREEERRRAEEADRGALPRDPAPDPDEAPDANALPAASENSPSVAAPAIPPSSASAPGLLVPSAPGGVPAQAVAPVPLPSDSPNGTVTPATPQSTGATYRPRRQQKNMPAGEQVLRQLNNSY